MSKSNRLSGIAGLFLFALLFGAFTGSPPPGEPLPFLLENTPWSQGNTVTHDTCESQFGTPGTCTYSPPPTNNQCYLANFADDDGDTLIDEDDPSCFGLIDYDGSGNGVCDTRMLLVYSGLESNPEYVRMGCTGWE